MEGKWPKGETFLCNNKKNEKGKKGGKEGKEKKRIVVGGGVGWSEGERKAKHLFDLQSFLSRMDAPFIIKKRK